MILKILFYENKYVNILYVFNIIINMVILQNKLQEILENKFPDAKIDLKDLVGDQNHYSLTIQDKIFNDKNMLQQHKIVNESLMEYFDSGALHALQIKTLVMQD
jgi:stress-induced morphogen